jgi:purine nucleosidase
MKDVFLLDFLFTTIYPITMLMKPPDVIIDTDIGTDIDDAYAIALAMKGHMHILGISAVSGDVSKRARIAKKLLSIGGMGHVPVFEGVRSRVPITHDRWVSTTESLDIVHGMDKLIEFYWSMIEKRPENERLVIVAIGPLSNISAVRARDPMFFDDRVHLVMMGGSIHKGYLGINLPMPEYNVIQDKCAARTLLASRVTTSIVPLDVTAGLKLTREQLHVLGQYAGADPVLQGLIDMTRLFESSFLGHRLPILYDPATMATVLDPSIAGYTNLALTVSRAGFTRIINDPSAIRHTVQVCLALNTKKFYDLFFSVLCGNNNDLGTD